MPQYNYRAIDKIGKDAIGAREAADEYELARLLKQDGLVMVSCDFASKKRGFIFLSQIPPRIEKLSRATGSIPASKPVRARLSIVVVTVAVYFMPSFNAVNLKHQTDEIYSRVTLKNEQKWKFAFRQLYTSKLQLS